MEKKKYTYDLTFAEVLEEIWYKDCWYQGNNFADGSVLEVTPDKDIYVKTFVRTVSHPTRVYSSPLILTKGVYEQMYCRVYTQPDAERRA